MKKFTSTLAIAALLAATLPVPQAMANKDTDAAIAGAIVLGILGAVVAHEQDRGGRQRYDPQPRLDPNENAIGACMLRAKRLVRNAGGYRTDLNQVNKIVRRPNGRVVVNFLATGYYDIGAKTSRVRCVVRNQRVVRFDFD